MLRPVNEAGECVTPSHLLEYRRTHEFRGPCSLCAALSPSDQKIYMEASIFLAVAGSSAGKYVAACAQGQCRYLGQFPIVNYRLIDSHILSTVCIERFYHQRGLLVKRFPLRGERCS